MSKKGSYFQGSSILKNHWKSVCQYLKLPFSQIQPNSNKSPWAVYSQKVLDGNLLKDSKQEKIISKLQNVYNDVVSYKRTKSFYKFIATEPNTRPLKGLYIYDTVGGKTMLMDMLYNSLPFKEKFRDNFKSYILNINSRILKERTKLKSWTSWFMDEGKKPDVITSVAKDITKESPVICCDDFQVNDVGNAMILKPLLSKLFANGCVVVVTSNNKPEESSKNGVEKSNILSYIPVLKENCNVEQLDSGIDYRLEGNKVSKNVFNADFRLKISCVDDLHNDLVSKENDTIRPRVINVSGRNVKFSKACGRILDSTFKELCERSLGASDYLEISKIFHTVFVRDMPKLTAKKHRDELKRFSTLISILNDNKVRVVIATDSEPKNFVKDVPEQGIVEWNKCYSRIMEMQTEKYWDNSGNHILTGVINRPITYQRAKKMHWL